MTEQILPNGDRLILRKAQTSDAAAIVAYLQNIADESDFLSFGKGEFTITPKEEEKYIVSVDKSDNQLVLVAEIDGEIAGVLTISANVKPRMRHIGVLGISVQKKHWNQGIGHILLQEMIRWAESGKVLRKINLLVSCENERAIHLYKKYGFEIEGCLRRDMWINGQFKDAYQMGKLID